MNGYGGEADGREAARTEAALRRRERRNILRAWLRPGIGIKRWMLVAFAGELMLALSVALLLRATLVETPAGDPARGILEALTLQFLPAEWRWVVLMVGGLLLFTLGAWRLVSALVEPYRVRDEPLAELLYQRRLRARGPRVVAIGGGTGLSTLLRGLKELTSNVTAVVTVADDGGSSGKLRTELGVPPMGDIRNCLAALADAEPQMHRLLQYRFPVTHTDEPGFAGHAFGNLLIAALTGVTGDFEEGVRQSNRVLAVRGNVVPVAGQAITLHAELADGSVIGGQSAIGRAPGIRRVWISPEAVRPSAEAIAAISAADVIVIGPGSVYTSILPPLLVPGIRDALAATDAMRLFVCNVATQVGETEGFAVSDHLAALRAHGLLDVIDAVLVNSNLRARQPANYPAAPVKLDLPLSSAEPPLIFARDVVDDDNAHHHEPRKLGTSILELYDDRVVARRRTAATA